MNAPSRREMRLMPRKSRVQLAAGATTVRRRRLAASTVRRRSIQPEAPYAQGSAAVHLLLATATNEHATTINEQGLSDALRVLIEELPSSEITEFIVAVTGADDELDPALWGDSPSTAEAARAHLANLTAKFTDRQTVLAQSITRADAAHLLGISDQAISDRLNAGDLIGLKDGRVWKLPAWQFHADTENGTLPGIAALRQHFPAGPVTLTAWVTAPNADLDNHTPAARLAAGDVDQVLRAAQAGGPIAW